MAASCRSTVAAVEADRSDSRVSAREERAQRGCDALDDAVRWRGTRFPSSRIAWSSSASSLPWICRRAARDDGPGC